MTKEEQRIIILVDNIKNNCYEVSEKLLEDFKEEIRADTFKEIEEAMYTQCFERDNDEDMQKWDGGNWFRYKLFENVLEQIKECKDV